METHVAKVSAAGTDLAALSRALEDLPAATHIVAVDADGVFPFVALNRAAEAFMRAPRDSIIGVPLASITAASRARPDALAAHQRVAETGRALSYRVLIERDESVVVQCTLTPLFDAVGNVTHILGIDTEVTDDVRSRLEADERFRVAFDDSPIGMVVCAPDGRLVVVNAAFATLLGYEATQLQGLTFDSITVPEDVDDSLRLFRETVTGERDGFHVEKRYRRSDGTNIPAITSVTAARGPDGRMRYAIAQVVDVTESVRAEQAVRDSEARFRALVLESGELIQLLDAEGTVLYASPAVERDLGWNLVGTLATDPRRVELIHPDDRELLVERFVESVARPHDPVQVEFRAKDRDGKWRNREAMLTNLLDDPRVGAVAFNARDITERRELEAQLRESQKMEAVGQLAGGIAHDFNNLLTAITGYAALLIDEIPEGHPMHSDLRQIQSAADRAAALVEQLLQFSRRKPSNPTLIDVNDVIESLGGLFGRIIGEHIRLDTVLALDAGLVRADRSQIERVVMNFVVNARDAMQAGGQLTIQSTGVVLDPPDADRLGLEPGRYFRLDVTDTGTGMEESVAQHVFEPFFTTKGVGKGTGLGLSTVYGIVAQTGGHVAVTSQPGLGTTFTVHLPVVDGVRAANGAPTVLLLEGEDAAIDRPHRR